MKTSVEKVYRKRRAETSPIVPCPCGESARIVTRQDNLGCSLHVTFIRDSILHYHRDSNEIYHILEGNGSMYIDDDIIEVAPGDVITIPKLARHRLVSLEGVKTIVFCVPAFSPEDEYFD